MVENRVAMYRSVIYNMSIHAKTRFELLPQFKGVAECMHADNDVSSDEFKELVNYMRDLLNGK